MKRLLAIKTHSIVDVITNSSSELFVCDTDKSIEFVRTALEDLLHKYNIGELRDEYNNGGVYNLTFDEAFGALFVLTEDLADAFIQEFIVGWSFGIPEFADANIPELKDRLDFEKEWEEITGRKHLHPWENNQEHNEKIWQDCAAAYKTYSDSWLEKHRKAIRKVLIGRIVIESNEDNSIPYELWTPINVLFGGINFHLG